MILYLDLRLMRIGLYQVKEGWEHDVLDHSDSDLQASDSKASAQNSRKRVKIE